MTESRVASQPLSYEFGDFRLDTGERLLSSSTGAPITLTPRAFDVLCYLLEHPGRLLEKDALMRAIWPHVVVDENNLSQHVSAVRRALGDGQRGRRYVLTIPGRGYRFVADVRASATADSIPLEPARAEPTSDAAVAVLPFANLSGDPSVEYFSDGMADEIINRLTRVPALSVASRTSSFAYKGKNVHVREIGRDLAVGLVLEGSVRKSADRIRVTAQLVDTRTGFHSWSQTYERSFGDLFALEDELVAEIVSSISKAAERPLSTPIAQPPPTRDLAAYEIYLRARAMPLAGHTLQYVVELYDQAIALDPRFARAHCGRAEMRLIMMVQDGATATWAAVAAVEADANRALALDPSVADAVMVLGVADALRWRWVSAEQRFRTAFSMARGVPMLELQHAAFVALASGHKRAALQEIRDAYAAAPTLPPVLANLAAVHWALGLDAEAVEYANLMVKLFSLPKYVMPLAWVYSCAALRAGRAEEAGGYMADALPPAVQTKGGAQALRRAYAALGDARRHAEAVADLRIVRAFAEREPDVYSRLYIAVWFTLAGALDDAYDAAAAWLEHVHERGPPGLPLVLFWIPEMAAFRADPRFFDFVSLLGLTEYWKAYGPPDDYELRAGKLVPLV